MQIIKNLNEAEYLAQVRTKEPMFSSSIGKKLILECPEKAYFSHPKLGGTVENKSTASMDFGNMLHSILLGAGPEIEVLEFDSYRTKESKEAKANAESLGKIPVKRADYDELMSAVEKIRSEIKIYAPDFFEEHDSELSVIDVDIHGVECQVRYDWAQVTKGNYMDLKSTTNAQPGKFERQLYDFGYDLQAVLYMMVAEKLTPELAGRIQWKWVVVENTPPYTVSILEPSAECLWVGEQRLMRALETWRKCVEADYWPGYGRNFVGAPAYVLKKEQELID